jgi:hypothetical protein
VGFLQPVVSQGGYSVGVTGYGPATVAAWKKAVQPYVLAAHQANVKEFWTLAQLKTPPEPSQSSRQPSSVRDAFGHWPTEPVNVNETTSVKI